MSAVKVLTAKVVDGALDLPDGLLRDGVTVTLLVPESDREGFRLPSKEQERLREAIAEAERGETVDGWRLLDDLRA